MSPPLPSRIVVLEAPRPASVYALLRLTAAWLRSWNCAGTLQMLDGTRRHGRIAEACHDLTAAQTVGLTKLSTCNCAALGRLPETFAAAQRIRPGSVAPALVHDLANGRLPGRRQCMGPRDQRAPRASCTCATAAKPQARLEDGLRQSPFLRSTSRPLSLSRSWEIQGLLQPSDTAAFFPIQLADLVLDEVAHGQLLKRGRDVDRLV